MWRMSDLARAGATTHLTTARPEPAQPAHAPPTRKRSRRRDPEARSEGARLARAIAISLGREIHAARRRRQLTQSGLGARVGAHQTAISRIERGLGSQVPLETWVALGVALGRPFAASLSKPIASAAEPRDAGHLAIQEHVLALARSTGRTATFELPTRPGDPARSIDVGIRDDTHRCLIVAEAWNTFGDLGAAVRARHRKLAEAAGLAVAIGDDLGAYRVAGVWVVRASATNRVLLARYPNIIDDAFPGSSAAWVTTLEGQQPAPLGSGLVWWDPSTSTLRPRRKPRAPRS